MDAVQDSLVAADAQVGSVPEPDGLRLSLYSAARQECLSQLHGGRTKLSGRAETTTLDELGAAVPDYEVAGPTGETVLILRAALDRLSDRDREVLNLTFRHRLSEADLAAVIGVSPRRARALLSEASTNFDHSAPVVAVLRAAVREGRARCSELADMLKGRDLATFPLTPQFASKLARHLESCAACALSRGDRATSAPSRSARYRSPSRPAGSGFGSPGPRSLWARTAARSRTGPTSRTSRERATRAARRSRCGPAAAGRR